MMNADSKANFSNKKMLRKAISSEGKASARFRNANTAVFVLAFFLMIAAMLWAFDSILHRFSADTARRYSVSSAEVISAHMGKEISLVSKAANSTAVVEWLLDEHNIQKKRRAFEELSGIIGGLYSFNLYVGVEKTLNEYKIEQSLEESSPKPFASLNKNNPTDEWYFNCVESDRDYLIKVGIDHVMHRKRVWLDYKVEWGGAPIGVICTGLEFSHITGELYSQYDEDHLRGFIIDNSGIIYLDSSQLFNDEYLYNDFETKLNTEFSGPGDNVMHAAINSYLAKNRGYFDKPQVPEVIRLPKGPYRFMTIAPIKNTDWSAIILSDLTPHLNLQIFIPVIVIVILLMIIFALATIVISRWLIFSPLEQLIGYLSSLKDPGQEQIYGLDRNDEFGKLSNAINDWFTKANFDPLTGIYNRRFMGNSMNRLMALLARSNGFLSILMIDVDNFKLYNDTYGHDQGDECLKAIAKLLAACAMRASDFAARIGGEEFAIVLPNVDQAGSHLIAEELLDSVRKMNMPHEKNPAGRVTVSVGVMTTNVLRSHKWDDYLRCADEALYSSKQNGRDRYTHHNYISK
jgi:diguanylate cyclase (GGDEF)-like protein